MLTILFYIIILIAAIPTALILSRMCRDEIKSWRKRLMIMSIICLILSIMLAIIDFKYKIPIIITLFFIIITNLTIIWESKRK